MEIWAVEVRLGGKWERKHLASTKELLLKQCDLYIGRTCEAGYDVRVVPYVADDSRAEALTMERIKEGHQPW